MLLEAKFTKGMWANEFQDFGPFRPMEFSKWHINVSRERIWEELSLEGVAVSIANQGRSHGGRYLLPLWSSGTEIFHGAEMCPCLRLVLHTPRESKGKRPMATEKKGLPLDG
jgi:hypothetical protein